MHPPEVKESFHLPDQGLSMRNKQVLNKELREMMVFGGNEPEKKRERGRRRGRGRGKEGRVRSREE